MFIRSANPIWYFVDLTGNQLNDTDFAFFLQNTFPYVPAPVYMDPDGTNQWSSPIQFLANGTLPDNMYFDPGITYRIEIRAGNTQADQLINLVENYVPNGNAEPEPVVVANAVNNQISNPQFFNIDFVSPLTLPAGGGTVDIAPGWSLILTGSGSGTVTQVITTINQNIPINLVPQYYLTFVLNGYTSAILQQTFNNMGDIWANQFIAMSVSALSGTGTNLLTLQYQPQSPDAAIPITSEPLPTTLWAQIQGAIGPISSTSNTASNYGSSTSVQIVLPTNNATTSISNVQVKPQTTPLPMTFDAETLERQEDHLFHYYENSILMEPKSSILVGWVFGLNPFQFSSTGPITITSTPAYICDQTILIQKTSSSVSVTKGFASHGLIQISAVASNNIFGLIQYIDPSNITPYWTNTVSSLVRAVASTSSPVNFKMRLIYRVTTPPLLSSTEPIVSWTGIDPTFAAGWTAIAPPNDPVYTIVPNLFVDFPFNNILLPPATTSAMTLGIVIYTTTDMAFPNGAVQFDSISLVRNDFAIESPPQTADQVLKQCEYYWEQSYANNVTAGAATAVNLIVKPGFAVWNNAASAYQMVNGPFSLEFKTKKRVASTAGSLTLYGTDISGTYSGTPGSVYAQGFQAGSQTVDAAIAISGNYAAVFGDKGAFYYPGAAGTQAPGGSTPLIGAISFHYIADARLGKF